MKTFFTIIFLLINFSVFAQDRADFWSRFTINYVLNPKWTISADVQYRTQANYLNDDKNIFHFPLAQTFRTWIYYHLKNQWTISYSPIIYFVSNDIRNLAGEIRKSQEFRQTASIGKGFNLGKIKNRNRFMYELRFLQLELPEYTIQHRYRFQNSFTIPLKVFENKSQLNIFTFNEIFIRTQNGITQFDQERIFVALQYKISKYDITAGYQWILQNGNTGNFNRNMLVVNLGLNL